MAGHDRSFDESVDSSALESGRGMGLGLGTLAIAVACGVGIGMLTAPETGNTTRKRLRKRLSTVGSGVADRWDDISERFDEMRKTGAHVGRDARKGVQRTVSKLREELEDRWDATQSRFAELEDQLDSFSHRGHEHDEGGNGMLNVALGLAAGAGLAYFILADDAAPARSKVQEIASDLRHQATNRWQQFRHKANNVAADIATDATSYGETNY